MQIAFPLTGALLPSLFPQQMLENFLAVPAERSRTLYTVETPFKPEETKKQIVSRLWNAEILLRQGWSLALSHVGSAFAASRLLNFGDDVDDIISVSLRGRLNEIAEALLDSEKDSAAQFRERIGKLVIGRGGKEMLSAKMDQLENRPAPADVVAVLEKTSSLHQSIVTAREAEEKVERILAEMGGTLAPERRQAATNDLLFDIALSLGDRGIVGEAKKLLRKASHLTQKIQNPTARSSYQLKMASLLAQYGYPEKAEGLFELAARSARKIKDQGDAADKLAEVASETIAHGFVRAGWDHYEKILGSGIESNQVSCEMFWTGASLFSEACRLTRHQEALFGDSFIEVFFADSFVVGVLDLFSKDWERLHRR